MMPFQYSGATFRKVGWLLATFGALALSACATGPVVRTRVALGASLAGAKTYAFVPNPPTNHGPYKSLTTQRLERDVAQQMQARGYTPAGTGEAADLLVTFRVTTHDRVEGEAGPAFAGYWGWGPYGWGGWGGWPYGGGWGLGGGYYSDVRTVTSAALTISIINRQTRSVIWSGTAVSDVTSHMLDHPGETIDEGVSQIFAHYPVPAR